MSVLGQFERGWWHRRIFRTAIPNRRLRRGPWGAALDSGKWLCPKGYGVEKNEFGREYIVKGSDNRWVRVE